MLLWFGFAVLTAAVVAALLRPLLALRAADASASVASAAVYRDQLAEIEAEHRQGLIGAAEAEAARVEIARRLLASSEGPKAAPAVPLPREMGTVAMVVAAALPVLAITVYLAIGAPHQPGQPFAARSSASGTPPGMAKGTMPSVGQLVAKVEARLRAQPEDGRGWDVIAPVYLRLARYADAAKAFEHAVRLVGESPERLAGLAEAHVLANDGMVTEAARKAYERLRTLAPDRMEPRFWLAVAAEQDGRLEDAEKVYAQLLTEGEAAAPWRPAVSERWRVVRTQLGLAVAPVPEAKGETPAPSAATGLAPALANEDVQAIQSLPEGPRRQMIEDMVAGLDKRLKDDGRDLEGWQRLIRAYAVLERREEALAALARARTALAGEMQSLEALNALARTLGLSS